MARLQSYDDGVVEPCVDLGEFRYAVARYVKFLIRARWKYEPEFLEAKDLERWDLSNIREDKETAWGLVNFAAAELAKLNNEFSLRCNSGGIAVTDGATPIARLIYSVAALASPNYENPPDCNDQLLDAAKLLREGRHVNWSELVDWDKLPKIRADLDQLPHPQRSKA